MKIIDEQLISSIVEQAKDNILYCKKHHFSE